MSIRTYNRFMTVAGTIFVVGASIGVFGLISSFF